MKPVEFYKMTGSGNDFVVLDGRHQDPSQWTPERIRHLCDRRDGVGADGLIILTPEGAGRVRMHFYNCDGGRAAMCGNGALCSTRLAVRLGMAQGESMRLLTDAGDFTTRTAGAGSEAELNLPPFEPPRVVPGLGLASGERKILFATVGVPHLVVLVEDVDRVDLDQRGRVLRYHPLVAPGGANVNFVGHPAAAGQPWPIRTYERGVEGETLACGTGTVAAGAVLIMEGEAESPVWFRSRSGRQLWVKAHYGADRVDEIWLGGEGRLVYQGCWVDA